MGGEGHIYPVVNIEPFRVVIHLFGNQGNAGHEAEGVGYRDALADDGRAGRQEFLVGIEPEDPVPVGSTDRGVAAVALSRSLMPNASE